MKARRSRLEISAEILAIALNGVSQRRIISKANVNSGRFREYLSILIKNELIAIDNSSNGGVMYRTTNKGRRFLKSINDAKRIVSS